jgi:shikimate kinase
MKNIYLIGYMGSGKSTVAAHMVKQYGMEVLEMDQMIVEREGMSVSDIFAKYGEDYFRDVETKLLIEIQTQDNKVVSCGGGVVLREQNVAEMQKGGSIVLLSAKPETILERVKYDNSRPLLQGNKTVEFISEMMEKRRSKYESAADLIIHTDGKQVADICNEIFGKIER